MYCSSALLNSQGAEGELEAVINENRFFFFPFSRAAEIWTNTKRSESLGKVSKFNSMLRNTCLWESLYASIINIVGL